MEEQRSSSFAKALRSFKHAKVSPRIDSQTSGQIDCQGQYFAVTNLHGTSCFFRKPVILMACQGKDKCHQKKATHECEHHCQVIVKGGVRSSSRTSEREATFLKRTSSENVVHPQIFPKSNFLLENAENRNMSSTGKQCFGFKCQALFFREFHCF